jgi:uncharacterized FlgJ-related protein
VCCKIAINKEFNKLPEGFERRKAHFMEDLENIFEKQVKIVEIQLEQEQNTF